MEKDLSPLKKQKRFIFDLAEDIVFKKKRNMEQYQYKKAQTLGKSSSNGFYGVNTFLTQEDKLSVLKEKHPELFPQHD